MLTTPLGRRDLLGLAGGLAAGAFLATLPLPALAQAPAGTPPGLTPYLEDKVHGDPNAPITVVEYASLACSHCADAHKDIIPELMKRFVETGQVKFIFKDFPLNGPGLRAGQLARCFGPERYEQLKTSLFRTQNLWLTRTFQQDLAKVARMAGITPAQFDACMAYKPLEDYLIQSQMIGTQQHQVNSTPTFILNDGAARVDGANKEELFRKLESLGAKPAN